jgi:hypothetical protein
MSGLQISQGNLINNWIANQFNEYELEFQKIIANLSSYFFKISCITEARILTSFC